MSRYGLCVDAISSPVHVAETIDRQLPLRRITKKFSSLAEAPAEKLGLLFGGAGEWSVRKVVTDAWIILLTAGMALCLQGYSKSNDPSFTALAKSKIGRAFNVRWSGPDLLGAATVRPFSSPIGVTFRSGFNDTVGFGSIN